MVIRGLWFICNLILLAAALFHTSGSAALPGRSSIGSTLALGVGAAIVALAAFVSFLAPGQQWLDRAAHRFDARVHLHGQKFIAAAALLVIIPLVILFSLPADLRYLDLLFLFNLIMLLVSLVFRPTSEEAPAHQLENRLLWLLLAVVLVVSFFSAHSVPAEAGDGDEVGWTNIAFTWATSGQAYLKISTQAPLPISPGGGWWVAPYGLWMSVFGVSLSAGRLFIWFFYAASVASIGWAGARLYGRTTGLIAAILTAASPFILSFRIIRPEIGLAAVGALLMVLYLASGKRPVWAFAAGWAAVLSLEIHAAGLAYIVSLIVMYAIDALGVLRQRRNPFERRQFAAVAGLAVGSLLYLAMHVLILPDPASYLGVMRSTRGFLDPGGMVQGLLIALYYMVEDGLLELLLTVLAFAALIVRGTPHDRLVLRFFAITLLCYFIIVPESQSYTVLFMPFIAWGIAAMITLGLQRRAVPPRPALSFLAAAAFTAPFFALSLPGLSLNPMPPAPITPVIQRARDLSSADEVVVGDVFAWWGLSDYSEYYITWSEYELSRGLGYSTGVELWAGLNPDLVFFVHHEDYQQMSATLRYHLDTHGFVLIDTFEWDSRPVEFWRRPDRGE